MDHLLAKHEMREIVRSRAYFLRTPKTGEIVVSHRTPKLYGIKPDFECILIGMKNRPVENESELPDYVFEPEESEVKDKSDSRTWIYWTYEKSAS